MRAAVLAIVGLDLLLVGISLQSADIDDAFEEYEPPCPPSPPEGPCMRLTLLKAALPLPPCPPLKRMVISSTNMKGMLTHKRFCATLQITFRK